MRASVLIVDDDPGHLAMLTTVLAGWGYEAAGASSGRAAMERLDAEPFDLVLTDVRMAGMDGLELLGRVKARNPDTPVLIMTAYSSVDTAVAALKSGGYDYLTKPLDFDVLKLTLQRALDHVRLAAENRELRRRLDEDFRPEDVIGDSRAMREVLDLAAMAAPTEATVLITGESGTGKELIARAIHHGSPRAKGPLVVINCAALPETLLESELFGHEKGAFTGAERRRDGRFLAANKGTIFLDEIGEIGPAVQAKLLRAVQEREIERLGGDRPVKVDVRIVAATNRDLKREVAEGRFREDLFYRLNVLMIEMPPLRRRREDVPALAAHFLAKFAERNRKLIKGFTPRAMEALLRSPWPGNVREVENAVERAVILTHGEYVTERELPFCPEVVAENGGCRVEGAEGEGGPADSGSLAGLPLDDVEKKAIAATLSGTGGNKSQASRLLGITRATLHKKLKKYGLG